MDKNAINITDGSRDNSPEIRERLSRIVDSLEEFNLCCSIKEYGSKLLETLALNMQAEGGSLYIIDNDSLELIHSIDPGHAPERLSLPLAPDSAFAKALDTGMPQLFNNIKQRKDVKSSGYSGYGNETALIFPLREEGPEVRGLLSLHTKNPPPFTRLDLDIGKIFMAQGCEALRSIKAAGALRESEERFRNLFASVRAGVIIIDEKTGIITDINDSALSITGLAESEVKGRHYSGISDRLFREDVASPDQGRIVPSEMTECTIKRTDGKEIHIARSAARFTAGSRSCVAVSFFDVTDIAETRKEVEGRLGFYQSIINTAHVIILLLDRDGNILFSNPYMKTLTGFSDNLKGEWTKALIPEGEREKAGLLFSSSVNGENRSFSTRLITAGKGLLTIMWFNSVVKTKSGDITGLLMIGQDITSQLEMEERLRQAEKMKSLAQLTGGIAHEFNNQLAAIHGYSEILAEELAGNSVLSEYVRKIMESSGKAADLTFQLLAYSGHGKYQVKAVDIHKAIKSAVKRVKEKSGNPATVALDFNAENQMVNGDSTQFEAAIMNLLTNSIEAADNNAEIKIATDNVIISNGTEEEKRLNCGNGLYLHISVTDNGKGVPAGDEARIFDPFFTTKDKGLHRGLGLSSAYGIVLNHNGAIDFKALPVGGTTFNIYLPSAL